jgi:hypothetical protein
MVERLEDWPWSRYRSMVGEANAPDWLDADGLLSQFGRERKSAIEAYRRFVKDGRGLPSPLDQTRHQGLLGDDAFVERYRQDKKPEELRGVSKAHRRSIALPLDDYRQRYPDRNEQWRGPTCPAPTPCRRSALISAFNRGRQAKRLPGIMPGSPLRQRSGGKGLGAG